MPAGCSDKFLRRVYPWKLWIWQMRIFGNFSVRGEILPFQNGNYRWYDSALHMRRSNSRSLLLFIFTCVHNRNVQYSNIFETLSFTYLPVCWVCFCFVVCSWGVSCWVEFLRFLRIYCCPVCLFFRKLQWILPVRTRGIRRLFYCVYKQCSFYPHHG